MSAPATARPSGGARRRSSRRHTVGRVIGISIVVLALVTGLGVVYTFRHFNDNLEVVDIEHLLDDRPEKVKVKDGEPINILVMGSDSREGANDIDGLTGGGERSDTTIVLHLSANRKRAYGVSIPRDSMVQRPECKTPDGETVPASSGLEMFNNAFTVGGPACTQQTVEQLTGIRIDDYVLVDFNGFKGMVDAIDGVEVCIPKDAADPAHGINLKAGTRTVRGKEALNYVRERHKLSANGDIGRMKRQQAFIASMANKLVSAGTLARPDRLLRFLNAATKSLQLSENLGSLQDLASLGNEMRGIGLDRVQFLTIPMELWSVDRNRVIWTDEAEIVWDHLRRDRVLPEEFTKDVIQAAAPPGSKAPSPSASGSESPSESPSESESSSASPSPTAPESPEPTQEELDAEAAAAANGLCA